MKVGLLGFLVVIGLSSLSVKPVDVQSQRKSLESEAAPSTPKRTPRKKNTTPSDQGTIITPAGRRSARLMRKKDA